MDSRAVPGRFPAFTGRGQVPDEPCSFRLPFKGTGHPGRTRLTLLACRPPLRARSVSDPIGKAYGLLEIAVDPVEI